MFLGLYHVPTKYRLALHVLEAKLAHVEAS